MRDKVIVITGASSGFGEALARRCAQAGGRVVLAARSANKLATLAAEIQAAGGQAFVVPTDVSRDEDAQRLAQAALERFGRVDVLVNNAGFGVFDRLVEARLDDLQEMMEVNVYGAVRCTQAFLPHFLEQRSGQIIMISSIAGLVANPQMGMYATTKHALVGYTRTLLIELQGTGVHCALMCPGVAETGFQVRAEHNKFSRISYWTFCTVDMVVRAVVRAILWRTHGEVIIPWYGRVLALASYLLPGATRLIMRFVQ